MPIYRVIRISMPDRPGALSAVTASLAAHSVDIVRLDVVSHDDGGVVDDLLLAAESHKDIQQAAAGFVPEVTVRVFEGLPGDPTVEMGEGLRDIAGAAAVDAAPVAVRAAMRLLRADCGVLLFAGPDGQLEAAAASTPLPAIGIDEEFAGHWVMERREPAAFPAAAGWAPTEFAGAMEASWVAMAPCGTLGLLVVGRSADIAFYSGELERLQVFAEGVDVLLALKTARSSHGSAPAAAGATLPARSVLLASRAPAA